MADIVECVPNFSEGRRKEVVDAIAKSIASVPGVRLLDTEMDSNHNRCVITFVGDRIAVAEAAFQGAKSAVARIDMNNHRGSTRGAEPPNSPRSFPFGGSRWKISSALPGPSGGGCAADLRGP